MLSVGGVEWRRESSSTETARKRGTAGCTHWQMEGPVERNAENYAGALENVMSKMFWWLCLLKYESRAYSVIHGPHWYINVFLTTFAKRDHVKSTVFCHLHGVWRRAFVRRSNLFSSLQHNKLDFIHSRYTEVFWWNRAYRLFELWLLVSLSWNKQHSKSWIYFWFHQESQDFVLMVICVEVRFYNITCMSARPYGNLATLWN